MRSFGFTSMGFGDSQWMLVYCSNKTTHRWDSGQSFICIEPLLLHSVRFWSNINNSIYFRYPMRSQPWDSFIKQRYTLRYTLHSEGIHNTLSSLVKKPVCCDFFWNSPDWVFCWIKAHTLEDLLTGRYEESTIKANRKSFWRDASVVADMPIALCCYHLWLSTGAFVTRWSRSNANPSKNQSSKTNH